MEITETTAAAQAARLQEREAEQVQVQKRIELRVTPSFFDAIRLLAEDEELTKADIIRKAISLYARARIEQKEGKALAFVRVDEENKMAVQSLISVI